MTKSITAHTWLLLWSSLQTPKPHFQVSSEVFKVLQSVSPVALHAHQQLSVHCVTPLTIICVDDFSGEILQQTGSLIWIIPDVSWEKRSELQESASEQLYPINLFELYSSPTVTSVQETKPFHTVQDKMQTQSRGLLCCRWHRTKSRHRFLYKCLVMHSAHRPDRNPAGSVIGPIAFSLRLTTSKL